MIYGVLFCLETLSVDSAFHGFPDMPCMKKVYKDNYRRRYTGQQPGTKSGRGPTDKPRKNRLSTAGFVPPSVYMGFRLFVLPETRPGGFSTMVRKVRGTAAFWANRPVGVPSCPSPPRPAAPPCAAPPRPARGMSGLWIRQVGKNICRMCIGR